MITLAICDKMNSDSVAGLVKNTDLFWEEAPLQSNGKPASGVWIVTRGGDASNSPKGLNLQTTVDFYVAFNNKSKTEKTHQAILEWMLANVSNEEIKGADYAFYNVRIRPTATPQNDGVTENGLIVKVASAQITYDLKEI